jgi:hypothetical protein
MPQIGASHINRSDQDGIHFTWRPYWCEKPMFLSIRWKVFKHESPMQAVVDMVQQFMLSNQVVDNTNEVQSTVIVSYWKCNWISKHINHINGINDRLPLIIPSKSQRSTCTPCGRHVRQMPGANDRKNKEILLIDRIDSVNHTKAETSNLKSLIFLPWSWSDFFTLGILSISISNHYMHVTVFVTQASLSTLMHSLVMNCSAKKVIWMSVCLSVRDKTTNYTNWVMDFGARAVARDVWSWLILVF